MASAQVARKQEHLEAGKRKLEEFRRKKAAEKSKKVSQLNATDGDPSFVKQLLESERLHLTDSNGVGNSDALAQGRLETLDISAKISTNESDTAFTSNFRSTDTNAKESLLASNNNVYSSILEPSYSYNGEYKDDATSMGSDGSKSAKDKFQNRKDDDGSSAPVAYGIGKHDLLAHPILSTRENPTSIRSSNNELVSRTSNDDDDPEEDHAIGNSGTSTVFTTNSLMMNSLSTLLPDKLGNSGNEDNGLKLSPYPVGSLGSTIKIVDSVFGSQHKFPALSDVLEKKYSGSVAHSGSMSYSSPWTFDHRYSDHNADAQSTSYRAPPSPPAAARRSHPSFLDAIPISRGPSSSAISEEATADSSSSSVYPMNGLVSSAPPRSVTSSVASGDRVDLLNPVLVNKNDFFPQKQNEDFAALEQHIEDLTQEKFSLQHALEASRALSESLASENSALTDSFNQQGFVVNQLKFDLESLQEDLKAQMALLEAVKVECVNAQLECNAADERAKLLASEVIGLEEKALRLRSNELKLERQLENSQAEISSYRKKLSSLEKDRQDLQATIDALQEEKKLLQSKLRKASSSGKPFDVNQTLSTRKDMSTSTEDLDINATTESSNPESYTTSMLGDASSSTQSPREIMQLSLEGLPMGFPSDQIRMIQNINTLIAELALEKEQLMQALSAESAQSSKLLELNKELTRKLEAQTQRLELLTARSMANDVTQPRQVDPRVMHESTTYADEGDEVVERVLGWIMKLFPGGPSRRRTSKHL